MLLIVNNLYLKKSFKTVFLNLRVARTFIVIPHWSVNCILICFLKRYLRMAKIPCCKRTSGGKTRKKLVPLFLSASYFCFFLEHGGSDIWQWFKKNAVRWISDVGWVKRLIIATIIKRIILGQEKNDEKQNDLIMIPSATRKMSSILFNDHFLEKNLFLNHTVWALRKG